MYCRSCGNKLGDMDLYCQVCGTPTGYQEPPAAPAEIEEEIVFNPPYENKSHFAEEEPPFETEESPASDKEDEDLKEFISEDEIEAHKQEEGADSPEPVKNTEFAWNVHEFPGTKKTGETDEIVFNWNMEDFNQPEQKEPEAVAFEEELFQEIRDESHRIKEQNIDRFFTFSKKNEEFQKLLDKEYEKFKMISEPEIHMEAEVPEEAQFHEVTIDTEEPTQETILEAEPTSEEIPEEIENLTVDEIPVEIDVDIPSEEAIPEAIAIPEIIDIPEEVVIPESPETPETAAKSEQISEMARARAQFFGEELIRDNDSIKKKLEPIEQADELVIEQAEEKENVDIVEASEIDAPTFTPLAVSADPADPGDTVEVKEEEEKPKRSIGQIVLAVIAIILVLEILILGIRFFAPNSAVDKAIGRAQTGIFNTVSGWADGINDLFSGKDSNEDTGIPEDSDKDANKDGSEEEDQLNEEQPTEPETPAPDPNPIADKNALVSSQMGNNINIEQVKANEALKYQAGKNYGLTDINNSKPITNNIWQTPENADPVYYDKSIVGTIIAFDSQWIDFVNTGNKSVLNLLKKDSEAYRKTANYSKIGKIKETFQLLEIGEIRQGSTGFCVWVHEEMQITENGTTTDKKYNWVYYLEPIDGKMQIVNYFKF